VTQAWRQPGSSFKPFIYSAALEKGFNPGTVINDEPIVIPASQTGSQAWEPHNYDGKYEGPMKMRTALAKSKNMVSIRILQSIGTRYAQDYSSRFGFDAEKHPPYLTMALGAGSVTPWQMVTAYSVFANGGFRVSPYVVSSIRDEKNQVLAQAAPLPAGEGSTRVIDPRNAFMMDNMLRDVTIYGTAAKASVALKRQDLAGKTGTTNEYVDAWFCGYQMTVAACAWVGFDQPKKLGDKETGGAAALPMWIGYMGRALKDVPIQTPEAPEGLVAFGSGRDRAFVYAENVSADPPHEEEAADTLPPVPDLSKPPSD
jgi:penicillin-binding protein 1A